MDAAPAGTASQPREGLDEWHRAAVGVEHLGRDRMYLNALLKLGEFGVLGDSV